MLAPQACVAVEIAGPPAAQEQRAALERRCSEILGPRRCRIVVATGEGEAACWHARITTEGGDPPVEASVVLADQTEAAHRPVRRDITFRPNDAAVERWATLGLVIAALVTVEEHSAAEAPPAAPEPIGGGFAPVVVAPAPEPEPTEPSNPVSGELRAAGVVNLGFLPAAALGARLEASLARGRFAGLVRGTLFPASTRATFGAGGAGGDVDLWSVGLGLCGRAQTGPWGARGCAGGDLARMRASGVGVAETNSASAWWETVWVGVSGAWRVANHLALTLDVEGAVVLQRPTFAINGAQATFTPAPVGGTLALGLAVPF
jgi:hypothetical protein